MSGPSSLLLLSLLLALIGIAAYFYFRRGQRKRKLRVHEITNDPHLLAHWVYSPDEWRQAVEDEFTWVKNRDAPGHVYISPTAICVKNDFQNRIVELGGGRVVTNAAYRGADGSSLKLRVRWRVVEAGEYGRDEVKYYKQDYWIPVPSKYKEEALSVAEHFTARIENNMAAYTAVVGEDEPLSLFGKDTF